MIAIAETRFGEVAEAAVHRTGEVQGAEAGRQDEASEAEEEEEEEGEGEAEDVPGFQGQSSLYAEKKQRQE